MQPVEKRNVNSSYHSCFLSIDGIENVYASREPFTKICKFAELFLLVFIYEQKVCVFEGTLKILFLISLQLFGMEKITCFQDLNLTTGFQ